MSFWELIGRIAFGALVVGGFWLAGSWLAGVVNAALARTRTEPLLRVAVVRALPIAVVALGLIAALSALGVDTRGLLIVLAALGLALALALRDPLTDVVCGSLLLSARPYALGDRLNVAGVQGSVREIALLNTVLETEDGARVLVRSARIWAGPLEVRRPAPRLPAEPVPAEPVPAEPVPAEPVQAEIAPEDDATQSAQA